jgi:putative FmdB family regulatory protein
VPIYEYRCDDCETSFEVLQRMSDDPLVTCEKCGGHLRKVLHPVAIHFKGSGFYTTDYGKGSGRRTGGGDDSSSSSDPASSGPSSSDSAGAGGDAKSDGAAGKAAPAGGKAKEKQKAT